MNMCSSRIHASYTGQSLFLQIQPDCGILLGIKACFVLWAVPMSLKGVLRFIVIIGGARYVTMVSQTLRQTQCVDSLDTVNQSDMTTSSCEHIYACIYLS